MGDSGMTTLTFDTLKFANRLKAAGVPGKQAEEEAAALAEVMVEVAKTSDLVNKKDLNELELRITKWIISVGVLQTALIAALLMKLIPS
jgi:hypothetical protein